MPQRIGVLVVVGVGLIGGSFALALKRTGLVERIVGVDCTLSHLQHALQRGVVDEVTQDIRKAVAAADVVLLAVPVQQIEGVLGTLAEALNVHTIVSDVASTKGDVLDMFRHYMPEHLSRCVPAHPIAGSEMSGVHAASQHLFCNRHVVVTPLPETDSEAMDSIAALWRAAGAHVSMMSAAEHDAVFAVVSHLPHLLAFAYMDRVLSRPDAQRCLDFASTGFRDFTRIAGSSAEMWCDIVQTNREALLIELNAYQQRLTALIDVIEARNHDRLLQIFQQASAARGSWRL